MIEEERSPCGDCIDARGRVLWVTVTGEMVRSGCVENDEKNVWTEGFHFRFTAISSIMRNAEQQEQYDSWNEDVKKSSPHIMIPSRTVRVD